MTHARSAGASLAIVDVTADNIAAEAPRVSAAVRRAAFVAIDTELTGLGSRAATTAASVEDRYAALRQAASSRALVSLGIACFATAPSGAYDVDVFNVFLQCQEPHTVEPKSLRFLAANGFDFNRQIVAGVPYWPGADRAGGEDAARALFADVLRARAPLIVHNGLIDLAFVHHHLVAPLPDTLASFTADLAAVYAPATVIDTKYIAEFVSRHPASFLEYLFRKLIRNTERRRLAGQPHVAVQSEGGAIALASFSHRSPDTREPCPQYASHGFCSARTCEKSHDIEAALDHEEQRARRRNRKRKRKDSHGEDGSADTAPTSAPVAPEGTASPGEGGHRAGFDAFMTGFVFAAERVAHGERSSAECANRICLSGKSFPLHLAPSAFTAPSQACRDKLSRLWPPDK